MYIGVRSWKNNRQNKLEKYRQHSEGRDIDFEVDGETDFEGTGKLDLEPLSDAYFLELKKKDIEESELRDEENAKKFNTLLKSLKEKVEEIEKEGIVITTRRKNAKENSDDMAIPPCKYLEIINKYNDGSNLIDLLPKNKRPEASRQLGELHNRYEDVREVCGLK